jgi:hypothetical protein
MKKAAVHRGGFSNMRHGGWPLGEAQGRYRAEVLARIGINPQWKATGAAVLSTKKTRPTY